MVVSWMLLAAAFFVGMIGLAIAVITMVMLSRGNSAPPPGKKPF